MDIGMCLILAVFIGINVFTFVIYRKEVDTPSPRLSILLLIILPFIGGAVGAVIANYCCDVESRELRSKLHKFFGIILPFICLFQISTVLGIIGDGDGMSYLIENIQERAGVIGSVLLLLNVVAFILVFIRKISKYVAPLGNFIIPDVVLIPVIILGGATGGAFAKVLFNFKEDWSCDATKVLQNFIYNGGMFVIAMIHIALFIFLTSGYAFS